MGLNNEKIIVGITHGDINGINYELILKTFSDKRIYELCIPILYGSSKILSYHQKVLDIPKISYYNIQNTDKAQTKTLNIVNCIDSSINVSLSQSTKEAGKSAIQSLERAIGDMKNNFIDVLVTAPINKFNVHFDDFSFLGHTEYLTKTFNQDDSLMFLISEDIKVGLVTEHITLNEVSNCISIEKILGKIRILHQSLIKDFVKIKGKIAVLSLNPHNGENGLLGDEENKIIIPAIKKAREEKILAFGPYPSDGFWGKYSFKDFDAVLAIYHDQGLIPFKMLAFDKGVNFTAGLPVIRTSPSHGVAYDLAGQNKASHQSFKNAIYNAIDIFRHRKTFELTKENSLDNID